MDTIIRKLGEEPFNPATLIIIFGLPATENEDLRSKVSDLFTDTLQVAVNIVCVERASSRDGKPGAVKVELDSTWEKVCVLRVKQKCN